VILSLLGWLNHRGATGLTPYLMLGTVMWAALLKSGVHATLAGAALALFIPMRDPRQPDRSPLKDLEHDLDSTVSFGILPVFAFANAGISMASMTLDTLVHPVTLGIAAGLVVGKQIGVFGMCWLAVRLGLGQLPDGIGWRQLYGIAILCGIGFTMSLFIGSLAFGEEVTARAFDERIGIVLGSMVSGFAGYLVLRRMVPRGAAAG
jgi:NhaA family Na+:H+ antiporter